MWICTFNAQKHIHDFFFLEVEKLAVYFITQFAKNTYLTVFSHVPMNYNVFLKLIYLEYNLH